MFSTELGDQSAGTSEAFQAKKFQVALEEDGALFYRAMNKVWLDPELRAEIQKLVRDFNLADCEYEFNPHETSPDYNLYSMPLANKVTADLTMSVTQATSPSPSGYMFGGDSPVSGQPTMQHINLVGYDGEQWSGVLPHTIPLAKTALLMLTHTLPYGAAITCLTQVLFGSQAGFGILAALGYFIIK